MPPSFDASSFERLKHSGDLPSPKGVALAIMRLTQQEDVSMTELAKVIRTDPAFVGRLIKAANGVIGFGRRPVASVQDALTVLGLPAVRAMALGFSLLTNYRSGVCKSFEFSRFWSVSLLMAVTAQALAMRTRAAAPDETYCLGLLARVGELALAVLYPKEYSEVLERCSGASAAELLRAESDAFSMNHAELGAAMLGEWGLPRVFTEAAYHYERPAEYGAPEGSRDSVVTWSLAIARQMGEMCVASAAERPLQLRRLLMSGSHLELDEASMIGLCDQVAAEWVEWGALLNVHAERLPPFSRLQDAGEAAASGTTGAAATDAVPAEAPPPSALAVRVLLASPQENARGVIRQTLLEAGYEVMTSTDGDSAAEAALDFQPDILIVERQLPGMSGDELVHTLRSTRIGRGLYMLALGSVSDEAAQVEALGLGYDDLLSSPVSTSLLLARVRAGQRVAILQREIEQDRDELRHFAAELAVSNRRLHDVAYVDALTGFPNRRHLAERLQQEWTASTRHQRPLSCLVLDLDNFRNINDTHGQEVGDTVLREVSILLRQMVRSQDVVARTGGDEFFVLCPDTALEAALACAERVRLAVIGSAFASNGHRVQVSVSIGVAARDAQTQDADVLLKRTEGSLAQAKANGRNGVFSQQSRTAPVIKLG